MSGVPQPKTQADLGALDVGDVFGAGAAGVADADLGASGASRRNRAKLGANISSSAACQRVVACSAGLLKPTLPGLR